MKQLAIGLVFLIIGAAGAFAYLKWSRGVSDATPIAATPASQNLCAEHDVDESICPFCNPELVESMGHCEEHDVAEALCTRCNDAIIPAFKATNDWCAGHSVPESQCLLCNHSPLNPKSDH